MSEPFKLRVTIEGYKELRKKLSGLDELAGAPWTKALHEAAETVKREVERTVPRRTGALAAAIKVKYQARPVPMWARVTANKTRKGFRYGWALNFSQKRAYYYRSGSFKGKPTRGWFSDAMQAVQSKVNQILERAGRAIEERWTS